MANDHRSIDDGTTMTDLTTLENECETVASPMKKSAKVCHLYKLPRELRRRIFLMAVTLDEPIVPHQRVWRSNKFYWSYEKTEEQRVMNYILHWGGKDRKESEKKMKKIPPLASVQLSLVSRAVYDEVAATHLFYEANTFDFTGKAEAVTYLVAITEHRRNAIRSAICAIDLSTASLLSSKLIAMLGSCAGLQRLHFQMSYKYYGQKLYDDALESLPNSSNFQQILGVMQGLTQYTVKFTGPSFEFHSSDLEKLCKWLRSKFDESMKLRRINNYNLKAFEQAHLEARLDVHGAGRLGEDKRPGIVASRTRLQTRYATKLDADGRLPRRAVSKYDLDGNLTWGVDRVGCVRKATSDSSTSGIEFEVLCGKEKMSSWEDAAALASNSGREAVLRYYAPYSYKTGPDVKKITEMIKQVVPVWELATQADIDDEDAAKHHARKSILGKRKRPRDSRTNRLVALIERQDRREVNAVVQAEMKAAKEAAKNARQDAKRKPHRTAKKTKFKKESDA